MREIRTAIATQHIELVQSPHRRRNPAPLQEGFHQLAHTRGAENEFDQPAQATGGIAWPFSFSAVNHSSCFLVAGMSHSLTVSSKLPDAKSRPSGLNATECTKSVCPLSVAFSFNVFMSHSLTVLSLL